jgi:hypothetical protein
MEALSFATSSSLKSDYWSFGVLIWELFSLSGVPYAGMNFFQYKSFIESGKRLTKPTNAPVEM